MNLSYICMCSRYFALQQNVFSSMTSKRKTEKIMLNQRTVKSQPVEKIGSILQTMKLQLSLFPPIYNACLNYLFGIFSSRDLSLWNCPGATLTVYMTVKLNTVSESQRFNRSLWSLTRITVSMFVWSEF